MTGKEFYTEFFGVKDPKEEDTTINVSVWRFAEAYAEHLKKGQTIPINSVIVNAKVLEELKGWAYSNVQPHDDECHDIISRL